MTNMEISRKSRKTYFIFETGGFWNICAYFKLKTSIRPINYVDPERDYILLKIYKFDKEVLRKNPKIGKLEKRLRLEPTILGAVYNKHRGKNPLGLVLKQG